MRDQYDAIRQARALLAKTPKSTARQTTANDYRAKVERLRERAQDAGTFNALIIGALKTAKKTSWQALRAALHQSSRRVP